MRAKRIDDNQNLIVKQLRKVGYSVYVTSMVGKGFPDIVVGAAGKNYLFEIKDSKKSDSRKRLTDDEFVFFSTWHGQVSKVENLDEILNKIRCPGVNLTL